MADFAALRGANAAGLTGGVRREVVVVHVTLARDRGQGIDLLLHLEHVQGGNAQDLGLAALEQGGTVGAWDEVNLNAQVTDVGDATAVDAEALGEDLLTHDCLHHGVVSSTDLLGSVLFFELLKEVSLDLLHVLVRCVVAVLLAGDGQQLLQLLRGSLLNCGEDVIGVRREERELLGFLSSARSQTCLCLAQGLDERLRCLKALSDSGLLRSRCTFLDALCNVDACACLNHHDGNVFLVALLYDAAGHDHLEQCTLVLLVVRECNPLALRVLVISDECHAHAADSAGNRQARQLRGSRSAIDGDDVVVLLRRHRKHGNNDLYLIAQTLDKGRAQWTVNQAAGQDGLGGGTALTAEEGARNLSGCVHTLLDVHGQWEEVKTFTWLVGGSGGGQEHGVLVQVSGDRAARLTSQQASLETDGAGAKIAIVKGGDCFGDTEFFINVELYGVLSAH